MFPLTDQPFIINPNQHTVLFTEFVISELINILFCITDFNLKFEKMLDYFPVISPLYRLIQNKNYDPCVDVCFIQQANAPGTAGGNEKDEKQKLECLASYSLFGNVMSMKSVTLPGAQRDALLLSFADAKVLYALIEPQHEKTCLCHIRTSKAQISLRFCKVLSAPFLFAA